MLKIAALLAVLCAPAPVLATTSTHGPAGAELRGEATFRFLGRRIYEARLFTPDATPLDWNRDFALELKYLRPLTKTDLVESTMRELQRTGGALPVRAQLSDCFADVSRGDRFTAVSKGQNRIEFWFNGAKTCALVYPDIKGRFMGIFLGDNTRSRAFTQALKGE